MLRNAPNVFDLDLARLDNVVFVGFRDKLVLGQFL